MRHLAVIFCFCATALCVQQQAHAQYGSYASRGVVNGLVSPTAANRMGLKRAWFTQIELDRSRARVTHLRQHVSSKRFDTKYHVTWPEGEEIYTAETVDRFGDALGAEGAEKTAKARVATLKDEGLQAKLETIQVPEITIFATTDHGTLHAINGATGQTKWVTSVGNQNHPTLAPAANDEYVAVINGANLFVMEQSDGTLVWDRAADKAPGAGPALTDDRIFVPTVTGKMEVYELEDARQPPWFYQSTGRLLVQPTAAVNSVSWATDRGYLYVGHREKPGVRFRLETRDAIVSAATFLPPNRLFVGSIDGYAYCLHEFSGDILWRFSVGDPITESPVVTKEAVYVVADGAGMYSINAEDGLERWWSPNIEKVLAVADDRVYCQARGDRFVTLDAKTGGRIDSVSLRGLDLLHTNWQTDRIFIGTSTGVLQCLHRLDAPWPTVHNAPDPEESARPEVIQRKDDKPADDKPADEPADPFGGGADPFAGGADPFAGGGGADPFAGGGDDGGPDADPFGGGADPFSGGGGDDGGGGADPFGGGGADPFGGGDDGGGADPFGGGDDGGGADPFGGGGDDPFG